MLRNLLIILFSFLALKVSAENKDTPWKDNGHVAWLIWGGDEGVDWAIKKMEELDESVNEAKVPKGWKISKEEPKPGDPILTNNTVYVYNPHYKDEFLDKYKDTKEFIKHNKFTKAVRDLAIIMPEDKKLVKESAINEEKAEGDRGPIDNKDIEKGLKSKADDTGVPIGLLRIVMRRGMDAWNSGHRPGTNQTQWGYARVNAFLEKGDGTWQKADKDVAKEVRDGGHDKKLPKKY